ncbi:kinesin-like protein KIF16B isoform X4 [Osmerus eperlanus]|uniref:kinesin-like protein KIF16B isoform X4 n=1 Tax=Osmerus eperlanus TaxID=29151 RepID=UPI002E1639EB
MASVRVAVRLRPMNRREKDLTAKCIIGMEGTKTTISNLKMTDGITGDSVRERTKTFTYDFSYDSSDCKSTSFVSQEKVFKDLGSDVLKAAFEGYNACIFAYGQTGSGKSYTMMGNPEDAGLIPRICEGLFSRIAGMTRWDEASFRTEVSYLEIYNERVRDLLRRKSTQTYNLRVREHPKDGPYVEDLSKHLVQNYSDVEELMEAGNINRTTASTDMNDTSSRSHAIFTINFTQAKFDAEMPCETVSKIHLVDLAGSERADATGATGVRLKEGGNINKSLVTLGNVISALADLTQDAVNTNLKKKQVFVPYRDSVLTWLLKDSLGGNSKTIMIATLSPADVNYGETLSTLRYANRAKNIINKPTINEDSNVKLIRELRAEIARLKALLIQGNQIALLDSPTALSMEEKLHQNEARVRELTKEWTNKWNETQNILKEETLALRKEGIGVVLDSELPHLIGIDDDLLSTGIILYHLKEGRTYVGRDDASTEQDIILHGLDLESEHCMFENQTGTVTLIPLNGAQCSVNGVQVTEPAPLNQGAVILLGRTNMFRFNHPKEAAKLREKRKSGLLSSFSLSMTDLSQSCENLSTVMLYNPGLEFERQQREELEKLEHKRRLIKEMEEKQKCEKAELERLQQEVESQQKESEQVQLRIRRQEESLRCRSQDIESRLRDLLAEKERFEEERGRDTQELDLQRRQQRKQQEEWNEREAQDVEVRRQQEAAERAEQTEIYRELERLKREREEQEVRLEAERRRLEEQEREQLSLVGRLEEQLRERHEAAAALLTREDRRRLENESCALAEIREVLLRAKEACERPDGEESWNEVRAAQASYTDFKAAQVEELSQLEDGLRMQKERLEKEVAAERATLALLVQAHKDRQRQLRETQEKGAQDATMLFQEEQRIKQAEQRLQFKERQLATLADSHLPAVAEERQRAAELLERGNAGGDSGRHSPPALDNTLYQVEKELEEKKEQLTLHCASAEQLQQLHDTYEFTANVARQEEKVRRKEKEILESRGKQQREALEQAVARLQRRHCALRRSISLEPENEELKHKGSILNTARATPELDQERVEREILKLKQRISESEGSGRSHSVSGDDKGSHTNSPVSPIIASLPGVLPIADERINAYIEEEVQRRLQKINLLNGDTVDLSFSSESLKDDDKQQNHVNPRKLKYEIHSMPLLWRSFLHVPWHENSTYLNGSKTYSEEKEGEDHSDLDKADNPEKTTKDLIKNESLPCRQGNTAKWWHVGVMVHREKLDQTKTKHYECDIGTKYIDISTAVTTNNDMYYDVPGKRDTNLGCYILDKNQHLTCSQSKETEEENKLLDRSVLHTESHARDPVPDKATKVPIRQSSQTQISLNGYFGVNLTLVSTRHQKQPNERTFDLITRMLGAKQGYILGYFAGKLTAVYKDAGKCLQSTQKIIRQVRQRDANRLISSYLTMVGREPQQLQLELEPKSSNGAKEVSFANLADCDILNSSDNIGVLSGQSTNRWPQGSVLSGKIGNPEVLFQKLVQFPECLLELQSLPLLEMLQHLNRLLPQVAATSGQLLGIYWLRIANFKRPTSQPGCLLLFETELYAISSRMGFNEDDQALEVFHKSSLLDIQEIQVSFAGQLVRFIGSSEETLLVAFTHNKDLTQTLCRTFHNIFKVSKGVEGTSAHPLLQEDLMSLSLDWRSHVPDLLLSNQLRITSRFKKDHADLLYILHGNMEGSGKPSLADICLLLYTCVKIEDSSNQSQDDLSQFILTDTHVGLLQEESVFHAVPQGSDLVPIQSQYRGIELRRRSDIRCLLVRQNDNCMVVDILYSKACKLQAETKSKDEVSDPLYGGRIADSWKLKFGCISEAMILINNLST